MAQGDVLRLVSAAQRQAPRIAPLILTRPCLCSGRATIYVFWHKIGSYARGNAMATNVASILLAS